MHATELFFFSRLRIVSRQRARDTSDYLNVDAPSERWKRSTARGMTVNNSDFLGSAEFRSFYDQALPRLYGYFFSRCGGDIEVAAELTQATFVSAIKTQRSGVVVAEPLPWIMSIARRRLIDHYRSKGRLRRAVERVHRTGMLSPVAEDIADSLADRLAIAKALSALRSDYRLALMLRYMDDQDLETVASLLGRSTSATESLLARARRALAKQMETEDQLHE